MTPLDIEGSPFDEGVDKRLLVLARLLHHRCQLLQARLQLLGQHQEGRLEQPRPV